MEIISFRDFSLASWTPLAVVASEGGNEHSGAEGTSLSGS